MKELHEEELRQIRQQLGAIAGAITAQGLVGFTDDGGRCESLTEAVMYHGRAVDRLASAVARIADAMEENA